jgi:acetolactate synthase-1/2/3 large subunit
MTMMTGAEIVIRCLQEEKVEYVFGYPGGAVLHIYDALFKQDQVKHVLVRHEQAAVHAADGLARSSHKVGVALVTSGPGATNAVTGIATAYMDSIPLVVISGQVPNEYIGQDAFQECDTVGITRPCVKHNFLVNDVHKLAVTIKKAFYIANSGRPGPVVIDIPKDVTAAKCKFEYPETIQLRSYNPVVKGHLGQIKKAVHLLLEAKRPMIYTGGGRHPEQRIRAVDQADASPRFSDHQYPDGPWRLSGDGPTVPWHARHAWDRRGQPGNAALRRAAGHRRPF